MDKSHTYGVAGIFDQEGEAVVVVVIPTILEKCLPKYSPGERKTVVISRRAAFECQILHLRAG